jgi:prepilin-type N-terminal cleavage/methylation domain-containing protein
MPANPALDRHPHGERAGKENGSVMSSDEDTPEGQRESPTSRRRVTGRLAGFTLIEMVIVVALIAVLAILSVGKLNRWREAEAVKSSIRRAQAAFSIARSEARRTGNNHIVFFKEDIAGNDLEDADGNRVPILVLDDGRPGSTNQNCSIDGGETVHPIRLDRDVSWGANDATAKVGIDEGNTAYGSGSTFDDSDGNPVAWVMFRPNGTPRAVNAACTQGALGTGGGGIYLKSAMRDAAVVLTPLGATRVFVWGGGAWH